MSSNKKSKNQKIVDSWRTGWDLIEIINDEQGQLQTIKCVLRNDKDKDDAKYSPAMANAIRRTMIADLPNYQPSREMMNVIESTSMLNPDILSHRLHLCPVKLENIIEKENPNNLLIKCFVQNNGNIIQNVYLKDLVVDGFEDPADFWTHPDVLWTKIQPGQKINLTTPLEFGTAHNKDSAYQPCSAVRYVFGTSEEVMEEMIADKTFTSEQEKEEYKVAHKEQAVWKTRDGNPVEYQFQFDNLGSYPVQEVIPTACLIIENRYTKVQTTLNRIKNMILSGELKNRSPWIIDNVIKITNYSGELNAFEFFIFNENDTMANQWTQVIRRDKDVKFVGYRITHPQDSFVLIRLALHQPQEDTIEYLVACIDKLVEHAIDLERQWKETREQWYDRCPIPRVKGWNEWVIKNIYEIIQE